MKKILVIEDEEDLNQTLSFNLENEGYKVTSALKGSEALEILENASPPDLVILDLMLPDMPGLDICRHIRSKDNLKNISVIIVTAKGEEVDRVVGFELGADDYIVKPFGILELTSRIKSKLRKVSVELTLSFEDLVMYPKKRIVQNKLKKINLTVKEFDILKYILINKENIVSKEEIYKSVWNSNVFVESRTLDVHVKSLRKKLIDCNVNFLIKTVRGIGYKIEKKI